MENAHACMHGDMRHAQPGAQQQIVGEMLATPPTYAEYEAR